MIRVLVVDDKPENLYLLRSLLQGHGYAVDEARHGAEALAKARQAPPQLIISDLLMPVMDGFTLLRHWKSDERLKAIPFVVYTATYTEPKDEHLALQLGADAFILKPCEPDSLTARIVEVLAEVARTGVAQIRTQVGDEKVLLREYSEILIRKLEEKALQLEEANRALRESEQRLRAIIENEPECVKLVSVDGTLQEMNPAGLAMIGADSLDQVRGKPLLDLVEQEHRASFGRMHQRVIEGEHCKLEFEIIGLKGSRRWLNTHAVPLRDGQGKVTALLGITRDVTESKLAADRIRRMNRVYAVLSGINALIVRVGDRDELFKEACRVAVESGGFRMAWLGVVDREAMRVKPVAWHGVGSDYIDSMPLGIGGAGTPDCGLAGQVIVERRAKITDDMTQDPRIMLRAEALERGFRSLAILPLLVADEAVGILALYAGEIGFFDKEEMKLLHELAGDIAFALDHIEKANKLDYLAFYDALTGLANRSLFHERLGQFVRSARQRQGKLALMLANVERFKIVNDSLGRQAGDELLKQLAGRLASAADGANIARVAGDQFAIMLPEVKGRSEVARNIERIWRECFAQPFQVNDTELRVSAKAGIAMFPNDGDGEDTLIANAEAALKSAQVIGERHQFHSLELTRGVTGQLALENQLRQALEKEQFVLHYQPKVDLVSRAIVGVEALIRWQSPELGLVPPMKFIPLMEELGLILEVGAWALNRAALIHRRWIDLGLKAPRVAVNVSPMQLRQRDFVRSVERAAFQGGAPTGIDLEITESLIMEDVRGSIEKLKAVADLGIRIAIDDFGTGYSSLGYLAKLPVQTLKIDRSFIISMLEDPDAVTLVSTIISLAHSLRLKVIAEGVEEEEQAKMLRLMGCDEMQGYLFSKPVPFDQMTALLTGA